MTPLLMAAGSGQGLIVKLLIESNANPGLQNNGGKGIMALAWYSCYQTYNWLQGYATTLDGSRLEWTWGKKSEAPSQHGRRNFAKAFRHWVLLLT